MESGEAQIVALLERLLAGSVKVFTGLRGPRSTPWAMPEIYVRFSDYLDFGGDDSAGNRSARRPLPNGYAEERPGRIGLTIEVWVAAYPHAQTIRETIIAPVLAHLETLDALALSSDGDTRTELVFRDLVPHLHRLSIRAEHEDDSPLYCGNIEFRLQGFLHVKVTTSRR
jgi:hypothetical protein